MQGLSRAVVGMARWLAILGGAVLIAITVMTVISIVGRGFIWAGLGPVPGDFELVEAGAAFAVFAFLPWCQINRGHATVDVFTSYLSPGANRVIDLISEAVMTFVIVLIAWRLWYGLLDKLRYNETTFILQFPVWWGYAAAMFAASVGVLVSLFVLYVRFREVVEGRPILQGQGVVH
ncbi:MAG: TRAP transporter small permease [Rhizobiaceae bacterium]|nr:TRAP transporter small permease [Rhizobiaceae bacterium]